MNIGDKKYFMDNNKIEFGYIFEFVITHNVFNSESKVLLSHFELDDLTKFNDIIELSSQINEIDFVYERRSSQLYDSVEDLLDILVRTFKKEEAFRNETKGELK